jgi:hypothetical protein
VLDAHDLAQQVLVVLLVAVRFGDRLRRFRLGGELLRVVRAVAPVEAFLVPLRRRESTSAAMSSAARGSAARSSARRIAPAECTVTWIAWRCAAERVSSYSTSMTTLSTRGK